MGKMKRNFKFSVVMAVYRVEEYIREALDSLISQSIGFSSSVQVILVDDGSPDSSGKICDEYAAKYPENILVIHKGNEGAARARRDGVGYAEGELVSFFDPDDVLSKNTLESVYNFYTRHKDETDVYAIPITFFGERSGPHPLNNKFQRGSRIIDLGRDWQTAQMSLAASFVQLDAARKIGADNSLATSEDAKELACILLEKMTLGVVANAEYRYRRRRGSLVDTAKTKREWYNTYLENYTAWAISYAKEKMGYLPKFLQYTLLYDLQWRYLPQKIACTSLSAEEKAKYRERLFSFASRFDVDVIMSQRALNIEHKLALLKRKNNPPPTIASTVDGKKHYIAAGNLLLYRLSNLLYTLHFIKIGEAELAVEGTLTYPDIDIPSPVIKGQIMGREYSATLTGYDDIIYSSEVEIARRIGFSLRIPLSDISEREGEFELVFYIGNKRSRAGRVAYGKFLPITKRFEASYYAKNGFIVSPTERGFKIRPATRRDAFRSERLLLTELWRSGELAARKAVIARVATRMFRAVLPKNIWLIADKSDRADDNGEALFSYLRKNKKWVDCRPIFAISKDSPDRERIKKLGRVVTYMSKAHKLLHLVAEHTVSAYSHDEISSPFLSNTPYYADLLPDNEPVFIQHGVIKDDLSPGLNKRHKNFSLFVTSSERERQSILEYNYGYTPGEVVLTGLPRYDSLYNEPRREITLMPTWQRSLFGSYDPKSSRWELLSGFTESEYFRFYSSLVNSDRLLSTAEKFGYKIQFMPHPIFFPYKEYFRTDVRAELLDVRTRYRDIFAHSSLIITDYSSVAFDFAYLRKPVIYSQFDKNHYDEGYFNYERDGFGEVEYTLEGTVDRIIEYMTIDCSLKEKYRERIDRFFAFSDRKNSERVYESIIKMRERNR